MKKAIIRLEGITKVFDGQTIIPKVDLTVYDGEFLTLLGPSGCGKTTLLRMIAGMETPTTGKIFIDDKDVTNLPPYQRDCNMVFQHYALFPHMTVEENIRFGLKMKNVPEDEQKTKVDKILKITQLTELRNRYPSQMSGGQQQRVAIARALVNNPKVVLLDEPLGALDLKLRKDMQLELADLQAALGLTFIFVTHDQEEALTMSDRIIVMNHGVIQQDDKPSVLYHKPVNRFVAKFIGETNFLEQEDGSTLVLRPEKVLVCPPDYNGTEHPLPKLVGKVSDVVFYGNIDKLFVNLDVTNQEVVALQYYDDLKKWKTGDRVGLYWYPEDEVVVTE